MADRDRLIKLKTRFVENFDCGDCQPEESKCKRYPIEKETDYLLANGVIVPPCKVGNYVRFKGLTTLWQVDAIHYYREGLPQITVTNGKITNTVTDFGTFEVFTKEEAEKVLKERNNATT